MVDKEKLEKLLLNPNQISWEGVAWLEKLSQEFPYFQSLRVLIAKHYLKENHLLKTHKIHSASAYAVDRNILRKRLLDKKLTSENVIINTMITSEKSETKSEIKNQKIEIEIQKKVEEIIVPEVKNSLLGNSKDKSREELLLAVQNRLAEIAKSKGLAEKEIYTPVSESIKEIKITPLQSLIKQEETPQEKIDTNNNLTENEPKKVLQFVKPMPTKDDNLAKEITDAKKSEERKRKLAETKQKKEFAAKEEKELKAKIEEETQPKEVFDSKLGSELNIETTDSVDLLLNYLESQKEKKKLIQESDLKSTEKNEATNSTDSKPVHPTQIKSANPIDIIEKFIQNDPRISKPNAKSKEILEDLSETKYSQKKLISENLAKIQAKQGYIKEAIDIYQELILKYPEKKSYFVSQINKLKN